MEMVELLLAFVCSTREGDWKPYCGCLRKMLSWFFAYDCVNYARYMTIYWNQMHNLRTSHPNAYDELCHGEFAVQQSPGSTFAQVPVDQVIEQSFNYDTKVKGGIVGFSMKPGAVHHWLVTASGYAAIAQLLRQITKPNRHTSNP